MQASAAAMIRVDLPTLERPAKATSGRSAGGRPAISTAPIMKLTSWAKRTRAASSSSSVKPSLTKTPASCP